MTQKIISLSGSIGSGKDTVADILIREHGFTKFAFAAAVKDCLAVIFDWDRQRLEGITPEDRAWRETVDSWWSQRLDMPDLTPRWAMQNYGTEVMRNHFHTDVWVASLQNKLQHHRSDRIVVTDTRFLNEFRGLHDIGAVMTRVRRGADPDWATTAFNAVNSPDDHQRAMCQYSLHTQGIHSSEWESLGFAYDHIIHNDGSLDELTASVNRLVATL